MSKRATITREMIVNAAFEITRAEGTESVNARSIAEKLGCTTQPVLYHFSTVMEIKEAVYHKADDLHTGYVTDIRGRYNHPMLEMGMQYIRFAVEEKHLFRLLFQSDKFASKGFGDIMGGEDMEPLISVLSGTAGVSEEKAREVFACIFLSVHGFASLIANNAMVYDEEYITGIITNIYDSVVKAALDKQPSTRNKILI